MGIQLPRYLLFNHPDRLINTVKSRYNAIQGTDENLWCRVGTCYKQVLTKKNLRIQFRVSLHAFFTIIILNGSV